jgi:ribonuclease R
MLDKVDQQFTGLITGVTGFGLFISLKDVFVEGLVHVSSLRNDYYHFDAAHHRLTGERSGKTYRLGDTIDVVVSRVNLDERRIDFILPPGSGPEPVEGGKPAGKSHKGKSHKGKSGGHKQHKGGKGDGHGHDKKDDGHAQKESHKSGHKADGGATKKKPKSRNQRRRKSTKSEQS